MRIMAALQAQNGGRKLEVRETAGSAASLRLLSSGYLQMAVVQADMAQVLTTKPALLAGI